MDPCPERAHPSRSALNQTEMLTMDGDLPARDATASVRKDQIGSLLVLVFIGGALGSATRELMTPMVSMLPSWATVLLINVTACLVVGWLYGVQERLHHHLLQFAAVGFCGGFSTFSHFADQVYSLASHGEMLAMTADVVGSVVLGVGAAYLGDLIGEHTGKSS
jgi:CrcB protein